MSDIVLKVEGLTKKYTIGENRERYVALRDVLVRKVRRSVKTLGATWGNGSRQSTQPDNEIYALKDVSFEVRQGEVMGIIGRNGAGKSTLLKILSRITEPTEGRVRIRGRVASLLEVGTGFHPELTGRENIFLNGAILGMTRQEIRRKFDEIVAFAEVEKFIDTPVKHYSSGMYVRLAFAVAAHLEPEILLVDEVLAVGDATFQSRCLGKMREVGQGGRTVLFVSHNLTAVRTLCDRVVLLYEGQLTADGAPTEVISDYTAALSESVILCEWPDDASALHNDAVFVRRVAVRDSSGHELKEISTDSPFNIELDYEVRRGSTAVGLAVIIYDRDNNCVLYSLNNHEPNWYGKLAPPGAYRSVCHVPGGFFNHGCFTVSVSLFGQNFSEPKWRHDVLRLEILDGPLVRGDYHRGIEGVVRPLFEWSTDALSHAQREDPE